MDVDLKIKNYVQYEPKDEHKLNVLIGLNIINYLNFHISDSISFVWDRLN